MPLLLVNLSAPVYPRRYSPRRRCGSCSPARSGIPAYDPDLDELTGAFERLADPELRAELGAGARQRRAELDWRRTVSDLGVLVG